MIKKLFKWGIIVWWIAMVVLLYQRTRQPEATREEINVVYTGELVKEEWFSVYIKGEKVGYTSKILESVGGGFQLRETSYLRLPVGGVEEEVLLESITSLDSNLTVRSLTLTISAGDFEVLTTGNVRDDKFNVVVSQQDQQNSFSIPLRGNLYSPALIPELIAQDNFSQRTYRFPSFDPVSLDEGVYVVRVGRQRDGSSFGVDEPLHRLSISFAGFSTVMYVTRGGKLIYEEGGGMTSYAEDKQSALNFTMKEGGDKDLLKEFAIPAYGDADIDNPRQIHWMRVKLKGIDPNIFALDGGNQQLISPDTLIISTDNLKNMPPPDSSSVLPEIFVQSNDVRIKKKAREIIKGKSDTLEMLKAINSYLYHNIKKEYRATIPSATKILSSMKGDCNEHSVLFVALARALNIPSEIVVGVIYQNGSFMYHSWVECYLSGRWVTFDPTLGQMPVDATHIRLLRGSLENQIQLIRLTNPAIWILSYKQKVQRKVVSK